MQLIRRPKVLRRQKARGVSLIEVLVSILLAAVGLLALAGSNVAAIRYSKLSQYRATASMLAKDIGERMRASKPPANNIPAWTNFAQQYNTVTDFAGQSGLISSNQSCYSYAATCSDVNLWGYDLQNWQFLVRSQLPEGSVYISIQAGQSAADVWVAWRDPAVANPDENSTDARNAANECPNGLGVGADKSIRCSFFRINL